MPRHCCVHVSVAHSFDLWMQMDHPASHLVHVLQVQRVFDLVKTDTLYTVLDCFSSQISCLSWKYSVSNTPIYVKELHHIVC